MGKDVLSYFERDNNNIHRYNHPSLFLLFYKAFISFYLSVLSFSIAFSLSFFIFLMLYINIETFCEIFNVSNLLFK